MKLFFSIVLALSILSWHASLVKLWDNKRITINDSKDFIKKKDDLITDNCLFQKLKLNDTNLSEKVFQLAYRGFTSLIEKGIITNHELLTIIDFSQPSTAKRLYVIDLNMRQLVFNTYVAHGQNSGKLFANRFSNTPNSLQSSLGFYITSSMYSGKHGCSLLLNGLEKGFNDQVRERSIVIHGASYVSDSFIEINGYLGRSWGCPAIPENLVLPIVNTIKNGTCLFIYANQESYLKKSSILHS